MLLDSLGSNDCKISRLNEKSLLVLFFSNSEKFKLEKISLRILLVETSLAIKSHALSNFPHDSTSLLIVDL